MQQYHDDTIIGLYRFTGDLCLSVGKGTEVIKLVSKRCHLESELSHYAEVISYFGGDLP